MWTRTMQQAVALLAGISVLVSATMIVRIRLEATPARQAASHSVHPLFDLSTPGGGPFPTDRFTVADPEQNTGRRVALPMPPGCTEETFSECDEVAFLNRLDGFNVTPRISIPFDEDIDPSTATSDNIFLVRLGDILENPDTAAPESLVSRAPDPARGSASIRSSGTSRLARSTSPRTRCSASTPVTL